MSKNTYITNQENSILYDPSTRFVVSMKEIWHSISGGVLSSDRTWQHNFDVLSILSLSEIRRELSCSP